MTMTRSTLQELIDNDGLKDIFGTELAQKEMIFRSFFDVESSSKASEDYQELFGTDLFEEVSEGETHPEDYAGQSYKTTVVSLKYAKRVPITEEMIEDDQYNKAISLIKEMARAAVETQETLAMNYLNNYASNTTADGIALIETTHLVGRTGETYANAPSTPASLSETSIQADWINVGKMKNSSGRKSAFMLDTLLVPRDLRFTAEQLLESEQTPSSNANGMNTVRNGKVVSGYVMSDYLTDATIYFYRTNVDGLKAVERKAVTFYEDETKTKDIKTYGAKFRLAFGCSDPRSIWGNGANLSVT